MSLAPFELIGHALVGRRDLPIPEWLFAWGASLVLIVSFVGLTLAWHRSRFEEAEVATGAGLALARARQPGDRGARRADRRASCSGS